MTARKHKGETAAILPSDTRGRKAPMTDTEKDDLLRQIEQQLRRDGKEVYDPGWKTRPILLGRIQAGRGRKKPV